MNKRDGIHNVFPKIVINGNSIAWKYENPIPPGISILIISIFLELLVINVAKIKEPNIISIENWIDLEDFLDIDETQVEKLDTIKIPTHPTINTFLSKSPSVYGKKLLFEICIEVFKALLGNKYFNNKT